MASVSKDIEYETPSGWVWRITAEATFCAAEPDVGIMRDWVDELRLFWTSTGKELSPADYDRIPDCLNDQIDEELYQAHNDG